MSAARRWLSVAFLALRAAGRLAAQEEEPRLIAAPDSVEPGAPVRVLLYSEWGIATAVGELVRADGRKVSTNQGFPIDLGAQGRGEALLLGVPATAEAGPYLLRVTGIDTLGRSFSESKPLAIEPRAFRRERLPLTSELSMLRQLSNERTRKEARRLDDILMSFDPSGVYQYSRLQVPLGDWRQTSGFGDRREYEYADGSTAVTIHAGLDLAAPDGAPVRAAGAGRVVFAGYWLITGNTVVLEHLPGVYSLYFHMRRLLVSEGEEVAQGAQLGEVGSTGLATGPHLHWEVRIGGVAVDPRLLLDTGLVDIAKIKHTVETINGGGSGGG